MKIKLVIEPTMQGEAFNILAVDEFNRPLAITVSAVPLDHMRNTCQVFMRSVDETP